jgi:hypothetical protein
VAWPDYNSRDEVEKFIGNDKNIPAVNRIE